MVMFVSLRFKLSTSTEKYMWKWYVSLFLLGCLRRFIQGIRFKTISMAITLSEVCA